MSFPIEDVRSRFPGLGRQWNGEPAVLFDGPAGSQVPQSVVDAVSHCLAHTNANRGGYFATSREVSEMVLAARRAMADFVGAADPAEIVFGAAMTPLTFALARGLAAGWSAGDEVIVSRLDHDANVTPWILAAESAGATVRHVGIDPLDCTLDLSELAASLSPRTRVVAVTAASNLVGTLVPVQQVARLAHEVGALVVVDAVHYAPHRLVDVPAWECDVLLCSPYKFFGPHMGVLWARSEVLAKARAANLRPAPSQPPEVWEVGTMNHEGVAGTLAAVEYLADLGRRIAGAELERRPALVAAFDAIADYEAELCTALLDGLAGIPELRVHGIRDPDRVGERTPTVGLTHESRPVAALSEELADRGIFTWHGNCYALAPSQALGLEPDGVLRAGLLHYNTEGEVARLLEALRG